MSAPSALEKRADYSLRRVAEFRDRVAAAVPELESCENLCIYTTGSFGRREAGEHSDLDLFFVQDGEIEAIGGRKETLIKADLIRLCRTLGYPEFSGEGAYLKIHTVNDLATRIGHPHEDAENLFTARMLLFLESTPLHNDSAYDRAISACAEQYFRDFSDHSTNFRPLFLTNDIMRFWKTLCLNYENARTSATQADKPKHRLKNFKLKFSRMMTCYSMLACLCDPDESNTPEKLKVLVKMTPSERIWHITGKHDLGDLYGSLVYEYEWFLTETDREKSSLLAWMTENKETALRRASTFGNLIFRLLQVVAEKTHGDLRYMVV